MSQPLILSGPIVRHVEPQSVSVWVALSIPCTVDLTIWNLRHDVGSGPGLASVAHPVQGTASRATIPLGTKLHIAVVTVELDGANALSPGQVYSYNLVFHGSNGTNVSEDLRSLGLLEDSTTIKLLDGSSLARPQLALGYDTGYLPSFATPPAELDGLRIVHASCRKIHGDGPDALVHLDSLIDASPDNAEGRPQQLFMTGDQIYADEVAPMLLPHLHAIGRELLYDAPDHEEHFDMRGEDVEANMRNLPSGWRTWPTRYYGKFSQGTGAGRSHLMTLSEYVGSYLVVWGNMAWPTADNGAKTHPDEVMTPDPTEDHLPDVFGSGTIAEVKAGTWAGFSALQRVLNPQQLEALREDPRIEFQTDPVTGELFRQEGADPNSTDPSDLYPRDPTDLSGVQLVLLEDMRKQWYRAGINRENIDIERLRSFYEGLPKVRRALANVATWMAFDDHDVTDDWFLSQRWRIANTESGTGRATIRNALVAFTLFQGWGNVPESWALANSEKAKLLAEIPGYADAIRVPQPPSDTNLKDKLDKLDASFGLVLTNGKPAKGKIAWHYVVNGPRHRVFVLDCRTVRAYPGLDEPPLVVPPKQVQKQIAKEGRTTDHVSFVVSSLPVLGHPAFDEIIHPLLFRILGGFEARKLHDAADPEVLRGRDPGLAKFEPEHWPLQPEAREFLLKRLAGHERVIVLSGEVHYSSANAMDYWVKGTDENGDLVMLPKARIIQLISSASRNAEPKRVLRPIDGAGGQWFLGHALSLASGEDNFGTATAAPAQAELELPGIPLVRYGWKSSANTMSLAPGELIPLEHRSGILSTPALVHHRNWPAGTTFAQLPDWAWSALPIMDTRPEVERSPAALPPEPQAAQNTVMDRYAAALEFHAENAGSERARRFSYCNHIGQIRFTGTPANLRVVHELYTLREDAAHFFPYLVHETRMTVTSAEPPAIQTLGGA